MTDTPDIHRLLEFQKLLLEFSKVERVTHRRHTNSSFIPENDTEHSYNLALTAWFLTEYFPHLDRDKAIRFALIHDLVEIHAGDTFIYGDEAHIATKKAREEAALKQLRKDWPDFPELSEQITEYETHASEEAKFVYALDKIMPIMLIYLNDGYTWKQEGITVARLHKAKKDKVTVSKEIKPYYDQLYELLTKSPHLLPLE